MKKDIKKIQSLCESAKLNSNGYVYYNALEKAFNDYGKEGLQHQVLYVLSNGRWSNKAHRKSLNKYGEKGIF